MASHDSDLPLSKEAQEYDDLIRETHAAQEELAGRRTPGRRSGGRHWPRALSHWLSLVALGSVVLALFIGLIIFMALSDSEDEGVAAGEEQGAAANPTPGSETGAAGSGGADGLAGTWTMYWTNSMDSENPVFTVVFEGTDTGTLEILEDATVSETNFVLEGDKVEFVFTRTMKTDIDDVLEESSFLGTLTEPDLIVGEWGRQDWECWPDPNADAGRRPTGIGARADSSARSDLAQALSELRQGSPPPSSERRVAPSSGPLLRAGNAVPFPDYGYLTCSQSRIYCR